VVLIGKPEESEHLEDRGTVGVMILKLILNKYGRTWNGFPWLIIGITGGVL
jgi:hypothetical protein